MNKKSSTKRKIFIVLALLTIAAGIHFFSRNPSWVERYYTQSLYIYIASFQRMLLGWIPFSMGDLLYAIAGFYLLRSIIILVKKIILRKTTKAYWTRIIYRNALVCMIIYIFFNISWGLNYSREGIATQLHLKEEKYTVQDVDTLVNLLQQQLNTAAAKINSTVRKDIESKKQVFKDAVKAYSLSQNSYAFLKQVPRSMKPSIYSYLGNYAGFLGYYNPFTGEAQVNTTVPEFLHPFIATHEMAHQVGYAKENEANFVGFLTGKNHPSINFKYAVYYDMYGYAINELWLGDTVRAKHYDSLLHPQVRKDITAVRKFYKNYKNPVEPVIRWIYGKYLVANNQPSGTLSYNEVVSWLIAYYKKYGKGVI